MRAALRAAAEKAGIAQVNIDDQLRDVSRVIQNLLDVEPGPRGTPAQGVLVGNSPGTGKTFIGSAVVAEQLARNVDNKTPGRILVVIPGKVDGPVVGQWKEVGADVFDFDMTKYEPGSSVDPGVYHMSATALGNLWDAENGELKIDFPKFDLVVFDESHLFSNVAGANRALAAQMLRRATNEQKVLHLSATPFEFPWDMRSMENLRLWGKGRKIGSFEEWLAFHGIRKSTSGRLWYFVKSSRADVLRTLLAIRREMMDAGVYMQRAMKIDKSLKNEFIEIPIGPIYGTYKQAVGAEISRLEARARGSDVSLLKSARVTFNRRVNELAKLDETVKIIKQFLELPDNFSIVAFTAYKMKFELAEKMAARFPSLDAAIRGLDEKLREGLEGAVRELGGEDVVAQVHGGIKSQKKRNQDVKDFQNCKKRVMFATVDAGGTGLSLHDTSGKCPRIQINLTTPWTGAGTEQLAGRTYRFGGKSDVRMIWMGVDDAIERDLLGRVAQKMAAMGALVEGKVSSEANKLMEFDFLPAAEMQQALFGYKKDVGLDKSDDVKLDSARRGKAGELPGTYADSMARIERATSVFDEGLGHAAGVPGDHAGGRQATDAELLEDLPLELPRANQKITKPPDIIGKMFRTLMARTFLGGIRNLLVDGRFYVTSEQVRLRSGQNVRVAGHEAGHLLDKRWFGFFTLPGQIQTAIPTHLLPFVDELKPLSENVQGDQLIEGFAEFVGDYIVNPKKVQQEAPKFFKYFRDHLNKVAPRDLAALDFAQQQFQLFMKYNPAEHIGARVAVGDSGRFGDWKFQPGRSFEQFYTHWLNDQAPFRWMDRMMMAKDKNWRSLEMLSRRVFGSEPMSDNVMRRGWVSHLDLENGVMGKRISKGLKQIFKPIDTRGKFDLFRYWAVALRAIELKQQGRISGIEDLIEDGTVTKLLKQIDSDKPLKKTFITAWRELKEYQEASLRWLEETGVLSPKQIADMREMNKFFVPFHRIMTEPDHLQDWIQEAAKATAAGQNTASQFVNLPQGIHFFKGSTRPIVDPIESIIGNTRYFTQLGWRKQVELQLVKFSDEVFGADGHATFLTKIEPKLARSIFSVGQIRKALADMGIKIDDIPDERLGDLVTLFHPQRGPAKLPIFTVLKDGKRLWYQVNDPDTWNALAGMNKVELGWLGQLAATAAAVLRQGVVISPEFMLRNFIRDSQAVWIQSPSRGRKGLAKGELDITRRSIPLVASVEGLKSAIKADALWDQFVQSGAAGAALTQISSRTNQEYMRQLLGRKAFSRTLASEHSILWNTQQVVRGMTDMGKGMMFGLQHLGSVMENANRVGAFAALREGGADMLHAGFGARNVSTDFSVHGASKVAFWRLSTAFMNPSAQGISRTIRAFKPGNPEGNKPLLTLARSFGLTFASALLWLRNRDDPDFQEIPLAIRTRYWIWRDNTTGTYWRIPKVYLYGDVFGSFLAEAFLDWAVDHDTDIPRRLGEALRQGLSFNMMPTGLVGIYEIKTNQSMHFGTKIESQSMIDGLPKEFRSNRFTTELAKRVSEGLERWADNADASILNKFRIGRFIRFFRLSPVQYDHLVRAYFGTMGYDIWNELPNVVRGGRNIARIIAGNEPYPFPMNTQTRNRFFIRGFTIQFPSASAESIRRFYEMRELFNDIARRYKHLQFLGETHKDPEIALQRAMQAIEYRERHQEALDVAPLYENAAAQMASFAKQRSQSASVEEIDQINRDALQYARDVLANVGNLTEEEKAMLRQRQEERGALTIINQRMDGARDLIDIVVRRRQVRGVNEPPAEEGREIDAIIRSTDGINAQERASLRRHYRTIRRGSLVEFEFNKTPRSLRRRLQRQRDNRE